MINEVKKCLFCVMICLNLVFSSLSVSAMSVEHNNEEFVPYIEVMWVTSFGSFDQMIEEADLVIYGQIIQQDSELYNDGLVYTTSLVKVLQCYKGDILDTIEISQIGGSADGETTPFPRELPQLEYNGEYVLCCSVEQNGYSIAGAGQGEFSVNHFTNWDEILFQCAMLFCPAENMGASSRTVYATPISGYYYPTSIQNVAYTISGSALSDESKAALKAGIESWNPYVPFSIQPNGGGCTLSVVIVDDTYGNQEVGNEERPATTLAITSVYSATEKDMRFYLETIRAYGYEYDTTIWRTLGAHEMGHALGLGHNLYDVNSVMRQYISDMSAYPQYVDTFPLGEIYF